MEAEPPEDGLRLLDGSAMKVRIQPVAIPELREFPRLLQRQRLASLSVIAPPRTRAFFRPEEQDVRSGEDQIVVPLAKGQSKGDNASAVNVTIRDAELRRGASIGVNSLDPRVCMQRSRDTKHVPRAVGVIRVCSGVDAERRQTRGEWVRHAYVERSRLQEERVTTMQTLIRLTRLLGGDSQSRGRLVRRWRALALDKKLVDEKPHRPVEFVMLVRCGFVHGGIPLGDASAYLGGANALNRRLLYATAAVILPRRRMVNALKMSVIPCSSAQIPPKISRV